MAEPLTVTIFDTQVYTRNSSMRKGLAQSIAQNRDGCIPMTPAGFKRINDLAAFSLVEVVIAIAVVSFALIGLIALFAVGLTTNKNSADETALGAMAWQVMDPLRGATNYAQAQSLATDYFFTSQGQLTNAKAYYTCTVSLVSQTALPLEANNATNLGVTLVFTWPSISKSTHTNTTYGSLPISNQ